MSVMTTDTIRALAQSANTAKDNEVSLGYLVRAVLDLCDEVDKLHGHVHTYNSPGDHCRGSHWNQTTPPKEPH